MLDNPLDKNNKQLHLKNVLTFYWKIEDKNVLDECIRNHKEDLILAIESGDTRMKYVHEVHIEALIEVLSFR
jgi:hypothetical protein